MKEEILKISDDLRNELITTQEASNLLLILITGCSSEELEQMSYLSHQGLPDKCINDWEEVKFCNIRNGDGNKCKHCSHYRKSPD